MCYDVEEEIDNAIDYQRSQMPEEIRTLIRKCNYDLYTGPTYYTEDGEEACFLDAGAKAFDFQAACSKISDYVSDINDISVSMFDVDEDGNEVEYDERIDGSAEAIVKALVGRELYNYVR